ncbi:sodium channel protein type 4 subunit alpha B-like isoform X2 [Channa argus]|uniref:sodium channel protein type 4 subunit alpha B-like isoform X2 n=1 Tax=Channa argus TaxID=215402 RepID=UPI003520D514
MPTRKIPFFEFWRSQTERAALLKRVDRLRLDSSQLKQLLGNSEVRAKLQNAKMASLLPPVGTEVFRRFTAASIEEIQQRHEAEMNQQQKDKLVEKNLPKPAVHLEDGKPLPFVYGDPPPQLLNTPLEELDPYYQSQKTFIVLGKGNFIHRFNAESSCFLLSPFSQLRTAAIKIHIHSLFRLFILMTILTNCVLMTMLYPPAWIMTTELVFIAVYTVEVIVKVMARGFCIRRFAFLRDPWNWLDFMVIITGFLTLYVDLRKSHFLSTLPRALKLITVYPGVRKTAGAFLQSVKRLAGVFVLMMFGLSMLSLIGLQLFMGSLRNKCIMVSLPNTIEHWTTSYNGNNTGASDFDFQQKIDNSANYYYLPWEDDALLCGNNSDAGVCPDGYSCLKAGRNPNHGFTSFDMFGWSLLNMFRLMTQDFWENLLQLMLRATGKTSMVFIMLGLFPICFCLLSLFLAMVAVVFVEQDEASIAEAKQKEEEFSQILEAIKKSKEAVEASSGADITKKKDPAQQKKRSTAEIMSNEQEHAEVSGQNQEPCSPCWYAFTNIFLKWNCCGCWRWLKQWLQAFVMNPFFDLVIVLSIVLNTLFMAMEHYPETADFLDTVGLAELVFTLIFIVEIIIRILAMDPYGYFKVDWNIYDFIIMTGSIIHLCIYVDGLSFLITLRVLRLGRWWPTFNLWIKTIWTSVKALKNLTFILVIMVFVSSLVAMQLFHEDYNAHNISPGNRLLRWHMSDFYHAFLVVVRILCGEWIETMWDCMMVSGPTTCLIFYFVVLIIGNLLVLNLFLALLLSSFCGDYRVPEEKRNNNVQIAINQIKKAMCGKRTWICKKGADSKKDKECVSLHVVTSDQNVGSSSVPIAETEDEFKMPENEKKEVKKQQCDFEQKCTEVQQEENNENHQGNIPEACCWESCYRCCPFLDIDTSQGKGRVWSNFRRTCLLIEQHQCFEIFMVIIILLSSVALVFEDIHLHHRPVIRLALDIADQVFAYLFLLEMVIKWTALGLKKYFSSFWCRLDFIILAVSLMAITAGMLGYTELGAGLTLKTLRTLRPLRALSRFQGPRVVLMALAGSLRSLGKVLLAILVVWLFFNILGVKMLAGKFSHCYNETSWEPFYQHEVNNMTDCLSLAGARWKNSYINFDSVALAYLALLQVATFKGWLDIMYKAVDSREVEDQPVYETNPFMYLYFISFIFLCCFFTFNIFIRVFIDALDRQKHKFGGKHVFMTKDQQKFSRAVKNLFSKPPLKPIPRSQNQCQAWLFGLVTHSFFEVFMVVLICLNMVALMVETYDQGQLKEIILYWIHFVFIIIFFIEFLLKIIALRKHYFTSAWNILDFTVLAVTIMDLLFAELGEKYLISPYVFPILRMARVFRILHLFHFTRGIQKLLLAFVMSLPALLNICFLLFVLMFTYSIFGMLNFAYVKKEAMIDDMINFETFGNSIICMFVITTRAGWDAVLIPFLNNPPDCEPDIENPGSTVMGNCVSSAVGIIFCTSYIILSLLLLLHLYIAVILEAFNTDDTEQLSDDDLQMFYKTWRKFDPNASQFIQHSQLSDLCDSLQDPLKIPKPNMITLTHMHLPLLPGDKIHCLDVLIALIAEVFGDPGERDALKAILEEMFRTHSLSKDSHEQLGSTPWRKQEEVAAMVIQRAYRKHRHDTERVVAETNGALGV